MSGNPGGRQKTKRELVEAFEAACPKAIATLVGILDDVDAKHPDKIKAAQIIVERVMGRPHQTIDKTTTERKLTPEQRREYLKRAATAVAKEAPELLRAATPAASH